MKRCDEIREWMSECLDGTLDAGREAALREHLRACPACARQQAELEAAVNLVRDMTDVEPPADLLEQVHARLDAGESIRFPLWNLFARPQAQLVLAAAMLLWLGIYGYIEFTAPCSVPELKDSGAVAEAPAAGRQQPPQDPAAAVAPADETIPAPAVRLLKEQAAKEEDAKATANAAVRSGMDADKARTMAERSAGPGWAAPAAAPAPVAAKPASRVAPLPAPSATPPAAGSAPRDVPASSALRRSSAVEEEEPAKRAQSAAAPMLQDGLRGAGRDGLALRTEAATAAPPAGAEREKAEAAPPAPKALLADSLAPAHPRPCVVRLAAAELAAVARVVEDFRAREAERNRAPAVARTAKPQASAVQKGQPEAGAAADTEAVFGLAGAEADEKKLKRRQAPTFTIQVRASQVPDLVARLGKLGAIAVENAPAKDVRESEDLVKPGLHAVERDASSADELVTVQIYLVAP
ncbi:MAG: zf-HC2 domain-containing protein [Verrucomicrobiota bacterium]|nr:zf-HC2 domain-containing protein [Verrucomicrobiota bacterium]